MNQTKYRTWVAHHLLNVVKAFQQTDKWFTTRQLCKQIRDQVNVTGQCSNATIVRSHAVQVADSFYKEQVTNDTVRNRPGTWEFYSFAERVTRGLNMLVELGWLQRRIVDQNPKRVATDRYGRKTVVTVYEYSLN
jgi:hypothetical protein